MAPLRQSQASWWPSHGTVVVCSPASWPKAPLCAPCLVLRMCKMLFKTMISSAQDFNWCLFLRIQSKTHFKMREYHMWYFSSIQLLSGVQLFATQWTAACQASLSITNSWSLLKPIESVMPSDHLILCCPLLLQSFLASGSFQMSQFFASSGQSIGVSASASVLPMNIQDWFPLGWTGLISLLSKELSRVFSNTTVQKLQFFGAQLSLSPTFTSIHDY